MKRKYDGAKILALPMDPNDAEAETVGTYLIALLRRVWDEGESFSGKRPFGNSGWDYDLAKPLISAGVIRGELDTDGYVEKCDDDQLRAAIFAAIDSLGEQRSGGRDHGETDKG